MPLSFIADENVESDVVAKLAEFGRSVDLSNRFLAAGASDEAVLELSTHADAILITSDKASESWSSADRREARESC